MIIIWGDTVTTNFKISGLAWPWIQTEGRIQQNLIQNIYNHINVEDFQFNINGEIEQFCYSVLGKHSKQIYFFSKTGIKVQIISHFNFLKALPLEVLFYPA